MSEDSYTVEARLLLPDSIIGADDLRKARERIAAALRRSWESGYDTGRLSEIDRTRKESAK